MKNYREIFNPTKITISGKSHILTTQDGKYVVKEKKKDLKSLYNFYLRYKNFRLKNFSKAWIFGNKLFYAEFINPTYMVKIYKSIIYFIILLVIIIFPSGL